MKFLFIVGVLLSCVAITPAKKSDFNQGDCVYIDHKRHDYDFLIILELTKNLNQEVYKVRSPGDSFSWYVLRELVNTKGTKTDCYPVGE